MLAAAALLLAGCSGDPSSAPPSTSHSSVLTRKDPFGCATAATDVTMPSGALGKVLGSGPTTVVFVNGSADRPCTWLPYAQTVADHGYQVLLWHYGNADRLDAVSGAVKMMRDRGARQVLLVGGSQGAVLSLAAAGKITPPIAGLVAMSPDFATVGVDSLSDAFAAVHVPLLEFMSVQDCSPQGIAPCKALFDRAPGPDKTFVSVPGTAHATALFHSDSAGTVTAKLDEFIAAHLPT